MQANPIVVDGVLYATTPKLHVFALDAATGQELWTFDPNGGRPPTSRFRHRGVVVTGDRVLFTYRNKLWALDKKTGQPIRSFGVDGAVDMREGLGRSVAGVTVSASTPGVVFEDMLIIGSTVSETLPGSPGDIRAYDIKTGALRWVFHTIPHPGEFGLRHVAARGIQDQRRRECLGRRHRRSQAGDGIRGNGISVIRLLWIEPHRRRSFCEHSARTRCAHWKAHLAFPGRET